MSDVTGAGARAAGGVDVVSWHGIPEENRNQIVTGDARELAKRIPDESIDLIFTDPVYDQIDDYRWLAETAARVLKDGAFMIVFYNQGLAYETSTAINQGGMRTAWELANYVNSGPNPRIWVGHVKHQTAYLCMKPTDDRRQMSTIDLVESRNHGNGGNHSWNKSLQATTRWIRDFTDYGDIVMDFFCGGGTVPAVCKMLGRRYVAFEILPDVAEKARSRVRETQPPLFVPQPKQLSLMEDG